MPLRAPRRPVRLQVILDAGQGVGQRRRLIPVEGRPPAVARLGQQAREPLEHLPCLRQFQKTYRPGHGVQPLGDTAHQAGLVEGAEIGAERLLDLPQLDEGLLQRRPDVAGQLAVGQ